MSDPCCLLLIGKIGWNALTIRAFSSGLVPPRVISILLAEYENWNVLVAFVPSVCVNDATSDLLGWFQLESTAGNGSSPHRFDWRLGAPFSQLSCV